MICKKCEAQNEDAARFCGHCGDPLEERDCSQAEPKKKSKVGILATIGIILIAVIIAGVFVMRTNQVKKQEQNLVCLLQRKTANGVILMKMAK